MLTAKYRIQPIDPAFSLFYSKSIINVIRNSEAFSLEGTSEPLIGSVVGDEPHPNDSGAIGIIAADAGERGMDIMQFKENADVLTSTGDKVGRIDRVVIDPKSKELTHLVVKKGFLFTEDKVVPLDHVETTNEDQVVLKEGLEDPDDFPDFEETHYIPAEEAGKFAKRDLGGTRPLAWYYPMPGAAWWRMRMGAYPGYPEPPYVSRTELNIPDNTVPLEEGAEVVGSEGDHVGDVERVYTEEEEQRVTHLLISQGLISKTRKLIPTMWVEHVLQDKVRLSVSKEFVEGLPEYAPQD
jgi:uncharacterized protein YrrD